MKDWVMFKGGGEMYLCVVHEKIGCLFRGICNILCKILKFRVND